MLAARWPAIRAAILAGVVAVHGLEAAPLPHVVTKADLQNPVSAQEVRDWSERLTALGYTIGPEELGQRVMDVTRVIGGAHRGALAPFRPILRFTGTGQGWGLFANPDLYPGRMVVRVRRGDGPYELVYRRLDPEHDWAGDVWRYRRVRGLFEGAGFTRKPRPVYQRLAGFVARKAFAADPSITAVELATHRTHTTLRGEPPDEAVEIRHVVEIER